MTSRLLPNGLSRRTNRCLLNAGIPINKKAVIRALKTGKLYPYRWPPNYGKHTHVEACRWVGIDSQSLSPPTQDDLSPYPANGLSYRANRCLSRSAIPATKKAVRDALRTGVLVPGKHPSNYGPQTHAELCRWTGVNPATLAPALPKHTPSGVENRGSS
jgi:hypothetical protein